MASNSPEIQQDPEHGRGWAVIRIPGVSSPPERFEFAIQDNANAKWFNDDGNWVGSQTEILPREWAHRGDTLELIVGPDVVNRLLPQPVWLIMSQVGVTAKVRWPTLEPSRPGTPPREKQRGQPPRRGNNGGGEPIDPKPGPAPPRLIATAVGLLILGGVLGALLAWLLLGDEDYRVANLRDQVATLTQERDAARADLADARDRAERLQEQLDRADGTDQRLQNLGMQPYFGSRNPFSFMDLQDVQELSNFFERRVSAYQVSVSGEVAFDEADLSPMARSFYAEAKRVSNAKVKARFGLEWRYPDYRSGLAACLAAEGGDASA